MTTFQTQRQLPASPAAVFAAIQDPARLAKWWGPNGFTNVFEIFEFVPGGRWLFEMIGPDGTRYRNESAFAHIEQDRQVVVHHIAPPEFRLTITLEAVGDGTLLTWQQAFTDPAVAAALKAMVEPANEQNLDRLTAVLQAQ